jgi:hypothetical protein
LRCFKNGEAWKMSDPDARYIFVDEHVLGPLSIDKLFRMAKSGDIEPATLFWSEREQEWRAISGIMEDLYPSSEKIADMKSSGIQRCTILGSGTGEDCPACQSVCDKVFTLDEFPGLPPVGCECIPWCRCAVIAAS